MANETHFEYSIDELQELLDTGRRLHSENPKSTKPVIRFRKNDGKMELLTTCTIQENTEE